MLAYQSGKQRLLLPLLKILDRCGATPNAITWFSVALGLAFIPAYLFWSTPTGLIVAHWLLFAHLLIDGVDGPLARFQNRASAAGSLTDTFGDQVVIVATALAYAVADDFGRAGMHPVTAGTYAVLYCVAVAFAMVRNSLQIPYRFLLRPRNFVYGLMWFSAFGWWGSWDRWWVEGGIWIFNTGLAVSVWTGFLAIRSHMAQEAANDSNESNEA